MRLSVSRMVICLMAGLMVLIASLSMAGLFWGPRCNGSAQCGTSGATYTECTINVDTGEMSSFVYVFNGNTFKICGSNGPVLISCKNNTNHTCGTWYWYFYSCDQSGQYASMGNFVMKGC